ALAGHAAAGDGRWHAVMTDLLALHVIAAAAWVGGLAAVLLLAAPRPALLAVTLPRFSTLAGACLLAVTSTGVVNALIQLGTAPGVALPSALVTSPYGLIVLAKTACLLAVAALAWRLRYRVLPAVRRHRRTAVAAWAAGELTLLCVAFGLAAALARTAVT
ncbi:MAG TPA: CopD family protein, partial [Pseudonocardiaceae bacterium]